MNGRIPFPASLPSLLAELRALDQTTDANLPTLRVRFLRNYSVENLEPYLRFAAYQKKIKAEAIFSDFNTFEQELRDPHSATYTEKNDLIVLTLWIDGLLEPKAPQEINGEKIFDRLHALITTYQSLSRTPMVITSLLPPFWQLPQVGTRRSSPAGEVAWINQKLFQMAESSSGLFIIDMSKMVGEVGEANAFDRRFWYQSSSPLKAGGYQFLAEPLAHVLARQRLAPRKVIAVDCDNTLWGGIIGEDGLSGIQLDPFRYPGSAFFDLQKQLLLLKSQGVLLTLCSKNNEPDVWEVFEKHPHALLKKTDFAGWRLNWEDKATNIRSLAQELNLGVDSFVFLDDNPTELEWVRQNLPMVEVLPIPRSPFEIPSVLANYWGFHALQTTEEDLRRTSMYVEERQRSIVQQESKSLDEFLRSLSLEAEIRRADRQDATRVSQLTQKTNQFNLTTRRYSVADIEKFIDREDAEVVTLRVRDRFGDYGLTGVAILLRQDDTMIIDSFLMSCRVLGKGLDRAFLSAVLKRASDWDGVNSVQSCFIPTPKNEQVKHFFSDHHFQRGAEKETQQEYFLDLQQSRVEVPKHISVV